MAERNKVDASPTRAFFVRMLTRDISLEDCILDLVDNSIDGAWALSGQRPSELTADDTLSNFTIDISLRPEAFSISDNCGGIDIDDAVDYAFTFGRKDAEPRAEFSVGVYGIGMKRAVFKLGNTISIFSTYREQNGSLTGFVVPIDVAEWVSDSSEHWDFDLNPHEPAENPGVVIDVADLAEETSRKFQDPTYEQNLRYALARNYILPLMRGLTINVNGRAVQGTSFIWQESEDIKPLRSSYDDDGVLVEIVAGMSKAPPNDTEPEQTSRADRTSGWYVICNGRAVLVADRTIVTGWGRGTWPSWHPQYNGFVGVALFSAADPTKLPMTTTKRSVDTSSGIYLRALSQMEEPTRTWINYTNARKAEREVAERQEREARNVELTNVQENSRLQLPRFTAPTQREAVANVLYAVPRKRLRNLAAALGNINMPYREVGTRSFDFAYEEFVDEDE
jgi:Histidine kinase-, DNA gyrase B-, and HSP90-like ATPase